MKAQNTTSNASKTLFFPKQVTEHVAISVPQISLSLCCPSVSPKWVRVSLMKAEGFPSLSVHRDSLTSLLMAAGQRLLHVIIGLTMTKRTHSVQSGQNYAG